MVKLRLDFSEGADRAKTLAALTTLVQVFETALRLLSPLMPFITEELWHALYDGNPPAESIALSTYPAARQGVDHDALNGMEIVQRLIVEVRALRKENGVEEKVFTPAEIKTDAIYIELFKESRTIIERLARVSDLRFVAEITAGLAKHSAISFDVAVVYERVVDVAAERERLTRDMAKYEKGLAAAERQLGNDGFLAKAPAHVVDGLKKQEAETRLLLMKAREALEVLPKG
jgi:valyl-tRNA synthetase